MTLLNIREAAGSSKELSGHKWRAKLLAADAWGSSGYYPADVLKRDGARVFHEGLQMHQDHPSADVEWQRPERSVSTLVGKLESNAVFENNFEFGPGLYADVTFYPTYVDRMKEIGKDVGLSIHAEGLTENSERDGRTGPIVTELLSAKSVDVVTRAGAGGKLISILENDRGLAGEPIKSKENQSMTDVTKEDFEALVAKFDSLPALFAAALKDAPVAPVAAATEPVVTPAAAAVVDATSTTEVAPVDHAAIVEALRANDLPAAVAKSVVRDVTDGIALADAIKAQVSLREAFGGSAAAQPVVAGSMVLREAATGGEPVGLARSLSKLGKPSVSVKGMK